MTARAPNWRAILDSDEATRARRAVADIAAALARDRERLRHDLADGAAGVALLFGYLAVIEPATDCRAVAEALLEQAADHLAAAPTSASLFHGFPGVAWAADHVRGLFGETDLAVNDDIDDAVALRLSAAEPASFDLITGTVGLGVYALERIPAADRCVDLVVDQLAATARHVPGGVVWTTAAQPDVLDLGLAHGIPGVIALLARCARLGRPAADTARSLLAGAVTWLLAQRGDHGSAFPSSIIGGRPSGPARSAWCYGDAAIALALLHAAEVGDPAWADDALAIARRAADRPVAETGVRDAGLCHGAAALALVYQRLHHATGDPAMRAAARAWVLRIFDYRLARDDLAASAGFFQSTRDGPIAARGLMDGAAGIALVLLAASSDVAPDWDRALLLG